MWSAADAMGVLGCCYEGGVGVPRDLVQAAAYFLQGAKTGNVYCQVCVADRYRFGKGVRADMSEVVRWYKVAVSQGPSRECTRALSAVASCLYHGGEGVEPDYEQAASLARAAINTIDSGDATSEPGVAELILGDCLLLGRGCVQEKKAAVALIARAAEKGYVKAVFSLGMCFCNGDAVTSDRASFLSLNGGRGLETFNNGTHFHNERKLVVYLCTRSPRAFEARLPVEYTDIQMFGTARRHARRHRHFLQDGACTPSGSILISACWCDRMNGTRGE
jgi:TPR repeat protein